VDTLKPAEIQAFYITLWGIGSTIAIPLDRKKHNINETPTEEILCAIIKKEI
jgi:hypothetical protein